MADTFDAARLSAIARLQKQAALLQAQIDKINDRIARLQAAQ